jgi:hypothetical protein
MDIKLEIGDLLLSKDMGPFTYPIRYFTGSPYTHVDIYAGELYNAPIIIGSGPVFFNFLSKVRVAPLTSLQHYDVYRMKGNKNGIKKVLKFAVSQLDHPYGYLELVLIGYRLLLKKLNYKYGFNFNVQTSDKAVNKWVCSELAAAGYDYMLMGNMTVQDYINLYQVGSGYLNKHFFGGPPITITPGDVASNDAMELIASI